MPPRLTIVDPLALKTSIPKDVVLISHAQRLGERSQQEDNLVTFSTDCVAIADGVGGMPHGDVAAKLASETAVWGYKHIRLRPFYWADKKLFIKRIFRSVNISVWQKQRETGFEDGMATTLLVLMIGVKTMWFGSVGDSMGFFLHNNTIVPLNTPDRGPDGSLTKVIGVVRYGLLPQFATKSFDIGDSVLLVTDGISDVMTREEMGTYFFGATTQKELDVGVEKLLQQAGQRGSRDNMTVCVVKRVAVDRLNIG